MEELPEQAVREFMQLFEQCYGINLDPEEAAVRARNFLNLYTAVLGDYTSEGTNEAP
jgi:hypothetical protein